ncbi:c-type cytochrome [Allopusillimonas ginsengisoli]|uniref:c-type cytochrome n=1 Tax=Allopusillimonas ginsengisoli TaxID=453575 RepID=UPI0010C1BD54|nr:cytochrome c [Allopusillimonas ginsengisoli]
MRASRPFLKGLALVALVLGTLGTAASAAAADVSAGRAKSMQCAVCHGPQGIATLPEAPNLAGQNEIYLVKALNDFKSGARTNEMMTMMVANLSEADIENLAAYYQSIEIVVKAPDQ